jgi:hypothetical protein
MISNPMRSCAVAVLMPLGAKETANRCENQGATANNGGEKMTMRSKHRSGQSLRYIRSL